jgi:hypothetical protein
VSSTGSIALYQVIELKKVLEQIGFLQDGDFYQARKLTNFDVFAE